MFPEAGPVARQRGSRHRVWEGSALVVGRAVAAIGHRIIARPVVSNQKHIDVAGPRSGSSFLNVTVTLLTVPFIPRR